MDEQQIRNTVHNAAIIYNRSATHFYKWIDFLEDEKRYNHLCQMRDFLNEKTSGPRTFIYSIDDSLEQEIFEYILDNVNKALQ